MINFDDIRPYSDEEIPDAMNRIAECSVLPLLASYVFPEKSIDEVKNLLHSFRTIKDFQMGIMYRANKQIISNSITEFSYGGINNISVGNPYLFISNHRDIMLDASLLQNVLVDNNFESSQITFGANLMMNQLVIDIGKSNKMFRVERPGGSIKDFYNSSKHLSDYIHYVIRDKKESLWIAQRNGRTKDGNDKTDQGIIKMFCMSSPEDRITSIEDLHIVPISVSYEWESCDILKTIEIYESRKMKYIKKPGEDLNSIMTGILQPKGRVHFEFCPMITSKELQKFSKDTNNEFHKDISKLIDKRIIKAYRLWPNNYIAYDLLYGTNKYSKHYTKQQYNAFIQRLAAFDKYVEDELDVLHEIFLGIYANPVKNKYK